MILDRYKINSKIFDQILYDYEYVVEKRDLSDGLEELTKYLEKPTSNCHTVYYDSNTNIAIVNYLTLEGYGLIENSDHYMKRCIIIRDENVDVENIYVVPFAKTCTKYINTILYKSGYTDEEIIECQKRCSIETHAKQRHENLPFYYDFNKIHKFTNCMYYDINNAHLDALCEIYPKAANKFIHLRQRINKYKQQGLFNKAQWLKDVVNIYCGNLGKINKKDKTYSSSRGTYEWIVQRTRNIIDEAINKVNGEILYSNTDGFIIHNPENKIITSDRLGEFKSELSNDIVYAYVHVDTSKDTTGYYLYQFTNSKNRMEQKGNVPCTLRDNIDLSVGNVITYKTHINAKGLKEYDNIKIENKEIIDNE